MRVGTAPVKGDEDALPESFESPGLLAAGTILVAATSQPGHAGAQAAWPNHPIRLIVPFPPGGSNDTIARVLGDELAARLGQPVVVENKTGAGGIIGTVSVTKSPPDGYTLLIASTTIATSTASGKKPPYGKSTNNLERSRSSGARQAEGLLEMSGHGAADRRKSNMRVAPGSGVYAATAEVPQRDRGNVRREGDGLDSGFGRA